MDSQPGHDTDRYVATVTPLASDPATQAAITDQITTQVFTYIDVQGLVTQSVEAVLITIAIIEFLARPARAIEPTKEPLVQ